jgi:Uma2 family endonuclease
MSRPAKVAEVSADEYLRWESDQAEKHEYFRGEVFAMVGASRRHVTVALNLSGLLLQHLRGTTCRAYMSDMKLRIEAANAYFYPDVIVTCDSSDHAAESYLTAPVLIAEVLSRSTEAYDRGEKFAAYRLIQSLREYVLVDSDTRSIEIYRLDAARRWVLFEPNPEGEFRLESVDLLVSSRQVFENV